MLNLQANTFRLFFFVMKEKYSRFQYSLRELHDLERGINWTPPLIFTGESCILVRHTKPKIELLFV